MIDDALLSPSTVLDVMRTVDSNQTKTNEIFESFVDRKILVACSGGPDSIALALMLYAFKLDFGIAYIEHGLSLDTAECELAVKNIALLCGVPFHISHLRLADDKKIKSNVEAQARKYRYEALEEIRSDNSYSKIVLAHHQDDYAETFLINLIRGSGSGISSMQKDNTTITRPLLHWKKSELIEFVNKLGIEYFSDPMNESYEYVRNRIRHELIPLMNEISKRDVVPLIARAAKHINADNVFLEQYATMLWPIDTASTRELAKLDETLQVHALRAWINGYPPSEEEMASILKVVSHENKSVQISGNRTIWRSGAVLYQDVTEPSE